MLEFKALGPFEVLRDGEPVELGSHKQRMLLAFLLVNANRAVSKDRIAEALWGSDTANKENALWVYVSRLRTVLEPERTGRGESAVLLTKEPGYLLAVEPECVDYLRFEQALASARSGEADPNHVLAQLDQGIESWRGDALADFAYEAFARQEIDRLEELRLEALELRFDARLRLGQAAELTSELETLSRENPFRERPVAQLMTALYRAGRQAEALRAYERHRRTLAEELGIDPSPELRRLEEQILLHDERLVLSTGDAGTGMRAGRNPYKGLHAFQEADAADFYGRESLLVELVRRLDRGDRLIALVGPSGSGKSSVVRAGLIPRVRKGDVTEGGEWLVAQMVPGAHPFAELEAALLRVRLDAPSSLSEQLAQGDQAIFRAALRVLPDDDSRLMLVIDQFEELFTLVEDRALQRRFLEALLVAVDDPHGRVTVVVTLRADFYDRPLLHPAFGARLGEALVNVTPLSARELEEAASEPAVKAGVRVEPALLGQLIGEVVDHPGALPMFQYTLTELFERRAGDVLSEASYSEIGGVRGAITNRAEDLFGELGPEEQEAARQLFLRLVSMSGENTWSRRRVQAEEIISLDVDVVALQAVIDRFGKARLLFFDRDRATGAPTVEIGHEALLTEWRRLGDWIGEAHNDLLRHASFISAVGDWERSGRDPGFLVTGARLTEYERWAGSSRLELNARELEFLGASLDARESEVRADRERTERETELARRARRRLWAAVAAAVVVVALGGTFAAVTLLGGPEVKTGVAVVTDGNEDAANLLLMRGVEQAAAELPIEIMEITPPISDLRREFLRLADAGAELIIVPASVNAVLEIRDMAPALPEVTFVSVLDDPGFFEGVDVANAVFAEEQGGFLAGVAAATETETGIVGFVGAAPVPDVHRRRAGFEAGVASVDPDVEVLARYIGADGNVDRAFQSPGLGESAAADLFARNADVVFHAAGDSGLGVFKAARDYTLATGTMHWGIGSGSDQILEVAAGEQDHVLTSVVRKFDVVGSDLVSDFINGELDRVFVRYTLADGALGYSTRGDHLSAPATARLAQAEADIIAGMVVPPEIPSGSVLEPLEAPEPVGTLTATYDGDRCTYEYDGPALLSPGDSIRIEMINKGTVNAVTIVFMDGFGIFVPANPGTTTSGFLVLPERRGSYDVGCGTEVDLPLLTTLIVN